MTARSALISEAIRLESNARALDDSHPDNGPILKRWKARAAVLRKAAASIDETAKCLEWALDLLDIYDAQALTDGHDEREVLSEIHIEAKLRAREALKALESGA